MSDTRTPLAGGGTAGGGVAAAAGGGTDPDGSAGPGAAIAELLALMRRLRDPERGCPWDREQTFASIAPYTLEEAYEVVDAVEGGRPAKLRDELGDLLFQVVFHARMAEELGWFDFEAVARSIHDKLVRRHPHVFGEQGGALSGAAALSAAWEAQKAREREAEAVQQGGETAIPAGTLADVPRSLPALMRAYKLSRRAARVGFDWTDLNDVRDKVAEELAEVDEAVQAARPGGAAAGGPGAHSGVELAGAGGAAPGAVDDGTAVPATEPSPHVVEELGDLLFAIASWSRHLKVDPEAALRAANAKFERRFACMEKLAGERGLMLVCLSLPEWEGLWQEAKAREAGSGGVSW